MEKRHIDIYKRIAMEANKASSRHLRKAPIKKYRNSLAQLDISAESKKKKLMKQLNDIVINTFSMRAGSLRTKNFIGNFKINVKSTRDIIQKIKTINNYLEEDLLRELGIIKKSMVAKALKTGKPERYLEKMRKALSRDYIAKIEHTVYMLMDNIVVYDKKLLKDYKKKEINIVKEEKLGVKDVDEILGVESELLDTLEAKMPPPSKIKPRLFSKNIFGLWAPTVLALLASLESEYEKEAIIFSSIKRNKNLRKKIERKIRHVVREKGHVLRIKHERAVTMKNLGKITDDYRQKFHEYVHAASL